ncbi:MAG: Pr6Pr family membrane protein [Afipia sp.]|jgi:hypothetical protein
MERPAGSAKLKRAGAAALAVAGWCALVLQYRLLIEATDGLGVPRIEGTLRFFSFFTIQTNILACLVLSAFALKRPLDEWWVHPFVRSAVAVYIAMVGLVYVTVLRPLWAPQGAQWLADVALHYVMPVGYLVFWLACVRKAGLRWYDPLLWLIYPLIYLFLILVRGRMAEFYPYPFIDAGKLGYAQVMQNAAALVVVCAILGAAVVVTGWWLARRRPA